MRWAFSKTYERTEKIKSLWASALDTDGIPLGPLPALSAHLPYPLRPSAPRTRSSDLYSELPPNLQRMPSYNSETYSPISDASTSEDPAGRPTALPAMPPSVYASGLVGERNPPSGPGSGYRNRGSLAQSLNVTLKLEDDSPEGGVWALPSSTSSSTSLRGGSRSRGNSRGASTSLGSSPGEMRVWRDEAQLEVTLSHGHYQEATDEIEEGLGFSLPPNPSSFAAHDYGAERTASASFARPPPDGYAAEPMSVGSSFDGYEPNPNPPYVFLDDPLYGDGYGRPQSGPDPFSYPTATTAYPSYPTLSPPPPPLSQLAPMMDPNHQHRSPYVPPQHLYEPMGGEGAAGPVDEPARHLHSASAYAFADPGPAYHPPSSTVAHQQLVLPSIYRHSPYHHQDPHPVGPEGQPYEAYEPAPVLPPIHYSVPFADQHAPYPTYNSQQSSMQGFGPPERMYAGEMATDPAGPARAAYFGSAGQRVGASLLEEGYTSDFPRHG